MAFKITNKPTFTTQVDVYTPNEKCGHDHSRFTARFSRVDVNEVDELRKLRQAELREEISLSARRYKHNPSDHLM